MRSWYVLVFNSRIMQWVEEECARLGVEVYSPLLVTVKARSDRPSSRRDETRNCFSQGTRFYASIPK